MIRSLVAIILLGVASSMVACGPAVELESPTSKPTATSPRMSDLGLESQESDTSDEPTLLGPEDLKDTESTATGQGSVYELQDAELGDLGEDDMSYLNLSPFMRIDQTPSDMIAEASDDCRHRHYALSRITVSHLLENYPVMRMVISGTIQAAYEDDPTLNLREYVPEEHLSPLLWAVRMQCKNLMDWLQNTDALRSPQYPSGSDPDLREAVRNALYLDNTYALAVLLDSGYDATAPAYDGFPLLHHALSFEAVEILTDAGADPNTQVWIARPIDVAAETGRPEVVRALYSLTENPSTATYFAMMGATARSNWQEDLEPVLEVLKTLRKLGAEINYPRPAELGGAPPDVTSAVDFARYQVDQGMDPTFLAFIEDWAKDQSADGPGKQDDQ